MLLQIAYLSLVGDLALNVTHRVVENPLLVILDRLDPHKRGGLLLLRLLFSHTIITSIVPIIVVCRGALFVNLQGVVLVARLVIRSRLALAAIVRACGAFDADQAAAVDFNTAEEPAQSETPQIEVFQNLAQLLLDHRARREVDNEVEGMREMPEQDEAHREQTLVRLVVQNRPEERVEQRRGQSGHGERESEQ